METVRVIENVPSKGGFNDDGSSYFWELAPHSIRMLDGATGRTETITWLRDDNWLVVTDDGHYRCSSGAERMLVYIAETKDGNQEIITPKEFTETYNWHNDPTKVQLQEE